MTPFRAFQLAIAVLILTAHVWIVQAISSSPGDAARAGSDARVASAFAPSGDNGDNADNTDNSGSDNDDNGNGNDNRDNSGDNSGVDSSLSFPTRSTTAQAQAPVCSTPGQETVFNSANQRVHVRVFPSTQPSIRVEVRQVFDVLSAPLPPGQLVGLIVYDVVAGVCENGASQITPIRTFPAEINLSFQYSDIEALGLDESRFEIAHLDFQTVQWTPVEKQAIDTNANAIAATIIQTGYYAVYQRP